MPDTVLFVVDGLGLSGKTRTLAYLASNLDPQRFRAEVCSFSTDHGILGEQLADARVPIHVVPCRDGVDVVAIARVAGLIRRTHATVVHCYNPRPILYGGIAAAVTGVRRRIGTLSAFACQVPDRTYDFLPQALTTTSRSNVWRNRIACGLMDCVTTVSESLGRRFFAYNAIPLQKLRVVPYGADLSAVERVTPAEAAALRRELGFCGDEIVVGSVGRLVEQKDYPTQFKAFALAAAQLPQLRMIVAGDGPLDAPLRQMAKDLGVDARVKFIGHWTRVPALLRSLDIFVLASKFEPFGVAILEAKAAGVAIVSTSVNEIPEILGGGSSGLLTPSGDSEAMADAFVKLASDRELRETLGRRAFVEARERHSMSSVLDAYQQLYSGSVH